MESEIERLKEENRRLKKLARTFARAYQNAYQAFNLDMLEAIASNNPNRVDVDAKIYSPTDILFKFSAFQGTFMRIAVEKFALGSDEDLPKFLEMESIKSLDN